MRVRNDSAALSAAAALKPSPPLPKEPEPARFQRQGDYWDLAFAGEQAQLHDLKGLRYLAEMVAEPGHERHGLELV